MSPGHQFIDARLRPVVDQLFERIGEPSMRVDVVQFRSLDQRRDDRPVGTARVGTGEECIFTAKGDRSNGPFNGIGVDLDAAVIEIAAEAISSARAVAHGFRNR